MGQKGQMKNKSCYRLPTSHKKHIKKRKGWKLEVNLEKPKLATTTHLKLPIFLANLLTPSAYKKTLKTIKGGPSMSFVDHAMLAHQ